MSILNSISSQSVPVMAWQWDAQPAEKSGFGGVLDSFETDSYAGKNTFSLTAGAISLNPLDFQDAAEGETSFSGFIEGLLASILQQNGQGDDAQSAFPLSPAFVHTFGTSGPLIEWINLQTDQLDLTREQNLALQN